MAGVLSDGGPDAIELGGGREVKGGERRRSGRRGRRRGCSCGAGELGGRIQVDLALVVVVEMTNGRQRRGGRGTGGWNGEMWPEGARLRG